MSTNFLSRLASILRPAAAGGITRWGRWGGAKGGDRGDLNPRPPGPQPGALTELSYGHHAERVSVGHGRTRSASRFPWRRDPLRAGEGQAMDRRQAFGREGP